MIVLDYMCSANGVIYKVKSPSYDSAIAIEAIEDPHVTSIKVIDSNYLIGKVAKSAVKEYMNQYECISDQ